MNKLVVLGSSLTPLLLAACSGIPEGGPSASANLKATQGNSASAVVHFRQMKAAVLITAEAQGLAPGPHGFHIHEKGDCSAPDATSAGGHFNPLGKPHGEPAQPEHHAGDMPMLVADASGKAQLEARLEGLTIGSGATDIVGRSIIIHTAPDDFKTQPTGNSGARVACGVIIANH
jgi:Cu-Zn family superoxide dismutase